MQPNSRSRSTILREAIFEENAELRARLEEAEEMLRAIRSGDVDALVIQSTAGPQVYTLQGQDAEANRVRGEMLAQVSDAVISTDREERVNYLNDAAERMYGIVGSNALGRKLSEIYETRWSHPEDEAVARTALLERGEWRGDNVHVRRDGHELNAESCITLLTDHAGRARGMLAVVRDVSERKLHLDKVLVSETRYRRLFEAAHDGVLVVDPGTCKIIDANPVMAQLLGCTHNQLVGRELFEVGLLKNKVECREMVRKLKQLSQVRYACVPLVSRVGLIHEVEVVANLYDENDRPVIQCNIRDITERKQAEERAQLLMAEVNHRAKNLLAVVQAVIHQTAKYGDPATFEERLSDRIDGLAAGQDLLVKNLWQGVEIADLVEVHLAHFKDLIGTRILIDGPPARLTIAAAQAIGMALHELSTNAVKYGALSNSDGQVRIAWQTTVAAEPTFSMSWLEVGGPKAVAPTRKGFGQVVIGRMAEAAVDGIVEIDYRETGISWILSAPVENTLALAKRNLDEAE